MSDSAPIATLNAKPKALRSDRQRIRYPRYHIRRTLLRLASGLALKCVCSLQIEGLEHLNTDEPLIIAANHFHFADPVLILWMSKKQVEFVAGFRMPHAPKIVRGIPKLWGIFPAYRGGYSRSTLDYPQQILSQNGLVGIFPEGGSWAKVLRPARPGTAYLAAQSGAQVLPVAIDGAINIFKQFRPRVTVTIGAPIGPFAPLGEGAERRKSVNAIGVTIMKSIAGMLPPERKGVFSDDAALREDAQAVAAFPFEADAMRGG